MGLFGKRKKSFDEAFAPVADGTYQQPQEGFWNGGGKFGGKDALAGVLAVLGDAFANQAGMPTGAVDNLSGSRLSAIAMAKKQAMQREEMEQARNALRAAGYDDAQANAMAMGVLKPSDVKPDRMMTKTGDIVAFGPDGQPNTTYRETSPELLGVPGQGVFAMDRRTGQAFGGGPKPGTVEDGHIFKGGDPADPANWQPAGGPSQPATGGFRRPPRTRR